MPETDTVEYESPVPEITAPIPTPQAPVVEPAPTQPQQAPPRIVTMPSRQLYDQQQRERQEADYLKSVYQQAQNVDQAVKDVTSARRMLGLLKADREIKSGVPVEKAMYNNLQYFVQPGQTGFAPTMKALQPPAMPRMMNIPGVPNPVPVDPRGVPHYQPRVPTEAAQETGPQQARPILSDKGELLGYTVQTGPKTFSHKWLADMEGATKQKIKNNDLEIREALKEAHQLQKEGAQPNDKALLEHKAVIKRLQDENIALATRGSAAAPTPPKAAPNAPAAPAERVRVKSKDGKVGTIPRSQLEEARKAGYSVLNAD